MYLAPVAGTDPRVLHFHPSVPPPAPAVAATVPPEKLDPHDTSRIRAAEAAARRLHPGPVGECVVDALRFYAAGGHRVSHSSLPARLVAELLRPPP